MKLAALIAVIAALTATSPVLAADAPPAAAATDCHPGADPITAPVSSFDGLFSDAASGLTPAQAGTATTVSVREAACLIAQKGKDGLIILAPMADFDGLQGAYAFEAAGQGGGLNDLYQVQLGERSAGINPYDFTLPLLVYGKNANDFRGYNAVTRMGAIGFSTIYWLRDGLDGWTAAGQPLGRVVDAPPKAATPAN